MIANPTYPSFVLCLQGCCALLVVCASGCGFGPSYPEGLPCSERQTCPPDQMCDVDGICRREPLEADDDSGGPDVSVLCVDDEDCPDGAVCNPEGQCVEESCADGIHNGVESDIDCGGDTCPACGDGAACADAGDCGTAVCVEGRCAAAECGDGVTNGVEACDSGVNSESCDVDCTRPGCNDGIFNSEAETCDTGGNSESCDVDCTRPGCNDGVFNSETETCDTGGNSESCDVDCTPPGCNDGVFNPAAETCDTGGNSESCDVDCTRPACGDSITNEAAGEECDDGNTSPQDGCSSGCQIEVLYAGTTTWNQRAFLHSDATQDVLINQACAASFPGSRGATMDELIGRAVAFLPPTNATAFWVTGTCPGCVGAPCAECVEGHARNCVNPGGPFAPPLNNSCHTHPERGTACVFDSPPTPSIDGMVGTETRGDMRTSLQTEPTCTPTEVNQDSWSPAVCLASEPVLRSAGTSR